MTGLALRSILAASDLGPASDDVVRGAASLAARTGAELHLLHAAGASDSARAEQRLVEQGARLAGAAPSVSAVAIREEPDRAILERAAAVGAEMIVLGPHHGGGVEAHVLGTTADRVIRAAQLPCLVVRGALPVPLHRIGVATDFSENARAAIDMALALAARTGEGAPEVHVFHSGWTVERIDDPGIERAEFLPELEGEVVAAQERAGGAPGVRVRTGVAWGVSPSETIVAYAARERLELLVLGTSGRGGLKRLLVGSVATGVARTAPCSVLLVPPVSATRPGGNGTAAT